MFKISSKAKNGGVWDGARVVKQLETGNADLAVKFKAQGCIVEEVEEELDKLKVTQLKKYAKDNGIDLGDATTKDAILAAIQDAKAK